MIIIGIQNTLHIFKRSVRRESVLNKRTRKIQMKLLPLLNSVGKPVIMFPSYENSKISPSQYKVGVLNDERTPATVVHIVIPGPAIG